MFCKLFYQFEFDHGFVNVIFVLRDKKEAIKLSMQWKKDEKLEFIDLYKSNEVFWYPKHPQYYNKIRKQKNSQQDLAKKVGKPVLEIKQKVSSLRARMRREKMKLLFERSCPVSRFSDLFSAARNQFRRIRLGKIIVQAADLLELQLSQ